MTASLLSIQVKDLNPKLFIATVKPLDAWTIFFPSQSYFFFFGSMFLFIFSGGKKKKFYLIFCSVFLSMENFSYCNTFQKIMT